MKRTGKSASRDHGGQDLWMTRIQKILERNNERQRKQIAKVTGEQRFEAR